MQNQVLPVMALAFVQAFGTTGSQNGSAKPSSNSRDAAVAATAKYRDAWLANSEALVMSTLSADATLLPGGMAPITGERAIRAFWWPQGGPTMKVVTMEQVVDDVIADLNVAVVRGHGSVGFVMEDRTQESRTLRHNFLNVVRRQSNGSWLIVQRMWSDLRE
jgi:ketosteroid isomerase-like protein